MLQPPQSRAPKGFRILDELAEVLAIDRVETLCPYAALVEQARVAQYPDVLRHAGPRQLEMSGDTASCHLPLAHQAHDPEARLVTQCLKFRKNGQFFVIHVNYYLRKKFLTTRWPLSASCVLIVFDPQLNNKGDFAVTRTSGARAAVINRRMEVP